MAQFDCVGGCGALVSRKGGRCRTCAGLLRRKKRAGRPVPATPPLSRSGAQIARHRREAPVQTSAAPDARGVAVVEGASAVLAKAPDGFSPIRSEAVRGIAEALKDAGFTVAEVRVQEATLLVRLTA